MKLSRTKASIFACLLFTIVQRAFPYTVDFYLFNILDGPGGFPANGGLLYVWCDRGTGFAPGPVPGAFTTGDDFRVVMPVFMPSDPMITGVGTSSIAATPGEAYFASTNWNFSSPGFYTDLNSEVYPVGSRWRFVFFPTLTPSSPPSAVVPGLDYAIATFEFVVPVEGAGALGLLVVNEWEWFVVPEPKFVITTVLALLLGGLVVYRRQLLTAKKSQSAHADAS